MFKIAIYLSLLYVICGNPTTPATKERPKQFRYVEEEEGPQNYTPSSQKLDADPHHQYEEPTKYIETHEKHQLGGKPQIEYKTYYGRDDQRVVPRPVPVDPEERRPLVSVNTGSSPLGGKNVDVGVNVGRFAQVDVNHENNFGQRALNFGLSVLNGLVKVNVQRGRDPFSRGRGPVLVQVGGHTVYDNGY